MKKHEIEFKLNGEKVSVNVEPNDVLLDALRNRLGVKSPKVGCDRGDCGTCTVIMNGRTLRSCLALAVEADGAEIVTLEGAGSRPWTKKLQKKFHEKNSFQCGFCAPGVILSAAELLEKNSRPSKHDIKEAIAGNLCRCTGYTPIIEAIEETAKSRRQCLLSMTKAEAKQLEMLREKTPEQRFAMMADMIGAQFEAMKAGIRFQNPEASETELEALFKEKVRKIYLLKH